MGERRGKTERSIKGLEATRRIWPATKAYKIEMEEHKKKGGLSTWNGGDTASLELLYALDILPQHIDSMATNFSAKQVSEDFILRSEEWGFPRDFCTYYKTVYGYLLSSVEEYPQIKPIAWPKPDLLVGGNSVCLTHPHGIRSLQKYFNIPAFIFDTPHPAYRMDKHDVDDKEATYAHHYIGGSYQHEIEEQYIDYELKQQKRYIEFLEGVTGKKLDMGKLKECVRLSKYTSELSIEIDKLRHNVPSPIGGADIMSLMLVQFLWAGSHRGIDIYEQAIKEAKEKVARGEGALPEEKYRIFFEGLPPWYSLGLFNYMQNLGAVSAIEAYPLNWTYDKLDPDYPLESLARKRISCLYTYSIRERGDLFIRRMKEFKIDGIIIWSDICCKQIAFFAEYIRERAEKELGIPGVVLDADQCDTRDYNEGVIKGRIDAFFELLDARKKKESNKKS